MKWFYSNSSHAQAHAARVITALAVVVLAQSAVAKTVAPTSVVQAVQAGNAQDVIVLFDTTKMSHDAHTRQDEDENNIDSDESDAVESDAVDADDILEYKVKQYRKIKSRALRKIGTSGVTEKLDYPHLPMLFVQVDNLAALQKLVGSVDVAAVYENTSHQHALIESLPLISQPSAQSVARTGAGTTVAVLDTGVNYTLAEFGYCSSPGLPAGCRVPFAQDFAADDNALDDNGHGTNVAAIVAAVAPDTRIVALDIFNAGSAFASDIIAAIDWAIANKVTYNIVAMNLSLGDNSNNAGDCPGSWASTPFANARAAGILPIVASGNNGFTNGINGPACAPGAVRVGAVYDSNIGSRTWSTLCADSVTAADQVACFSNSAATLTLLAPGSIITAGGFSNSGTSQASPHVAGAVAVLRAANSFPTESLDQTVVRMQNTGDLISDPKNNRITPRLNLGRAVIPPP
ncbi:MAG: S8 family serine peptidase [Pseudomonadota bacterium]